MSGGESWLLEDRVIWRMTSPITPCEASVRSRSPGPNRGSGEAEGRSCGSCGPEGRGQGKGRVRGREGAAAKRVK